ncbi:hypothetical protein HMH01_08085 [Halovulum dunhuangense]|uniref:Uncharacterized protein n=1 Tax=Halovulum dunhuangense TaxID=1505036 RepID=A0A849L2A0_9RHOB|nr:hypothetical protein [Halovulum dunhuangense]NNU80399.1 hypothetical protein [Halovulum dunhuangense]
MDKRTLGVGLRLRIHRLDQVTEKMKKAGPHRGEENFEFLGKVMPDRARRKQSLERVLA